MAQFEDALAQLKRTISKSHAKGKGSHEETIGQVSSYLVFMKSSVLSQEATEKLAKCLRERLIQVYAAFPQRSLEFAAALCQTIYETKVLPAFAAGKHEQKTLWEKILNALLSGVLDFHDAKPSDKFKEAIGVALYPTVCSTFFSISIPHMSVELRSTGYSVLSETADSHKGNQARLLDPKLLGGYVRAVMLHKVC
ncbi:hypothetical protein BDW22DRAFT_1399220 [Trametopsis cervina]|nr:hypothetical protein BDW22DRAFT_1399220 [Trametopsis cervina]